MPQLHKTNLACKIVYEHFGKQAELVVTTLLKKGRQSFLELLGACNAARSNSSAQPPPPPLSKSLLKQVLLVLIQQNCVRTYLQPAEVRVTGVRPAVYLYEADQLQILQIIRRPKFLQHIKDETPAHASNDVSTVIVEVLLEHGRLRFDQISNAVVARLTQDAAAAAKQQQQQQPAADGQQPDQQQQEAAATDPKVREYTEAVRWSFVQLLQEHYIERSPPCNLPPPQPVSAAPSKAKKAAPKPGSAEYAEAQSKALQALAHKTYAEARFKAPRELVAGMEDDSLLGISTEAEAATAAAAAVAAAADSKPTKKRKKMAGGVTAEGALAVQAAAAAEAAAANATVAKQAAALANSNSKRRKTNTGKASRAAGNAAVDGDAADGLQESANGVAVKLEDIGPGGSAADADAPLTAAARKRGKRAGTTATAAAAAAAGTAGTAQEEEDPPTAAEMLWRVNPEEFNRRFRNKVMVDLVADKLGADAGTVLAAMLSHGRRFETTVEGDVSIAMGVPDVMSALKAGQDTGRLPQLSEGTSVEALLNALAFDGLGCVDSNSTGPTGVTYSVNMRMLLERARLLQLNAVVRDKFGIIGLRIFNTLMVNGQLEQKQVADYVMQPHKETRELLYRMFRAGYMLMQDIPRTSDRAPTRSFYTWHVDLDAIFKRLADDLYQAAANLHARHAYELAQHSELVELVESARAAGTLNFNMTDSQRRMLERLNKVTTALETSLLRLDSMIALFNEY